MTGSFPFQTNLSEADLTENIKGGKFDYSTSAFVGYSERAITVVKNMLKVDPAIRITAGEIEDCAWVQGKEHKPTYSPKPIYSLKIIKIGDTTCRSLTLLAPNILTHTLAFCSVTVIYCQ